MGEKGLEGGGVAQASSAVGGAVTSTGADPGPGRYGYRKNPDGSDQLDDEGRRIPRNTQNSADYSDEERRAAGEHVPTAEEKAKQEAQDRADDLRDKRNAVQGRQGQVDDATKNLEEQERKRAALQNDLKNAEDPGLRKALEGQMAGADKAVGGAQKTLDYYKGQLGGAQKDLAQLEGGGGGGKP